MGDSSATLLIAWYAIVLRAEVDVMFVDREIEVRRRRRAVLDRRRSTRARWFSRAEPAEISFRRIVKAQQQIALEQLAGMVGEEDDPPRTPMRACRDDGVVFFRQRESRVCSTLPLRAGRRSAVAEEDWGDGSPAQGSPTLPLPEGEGFVFQIHSGEVAQSCFGDRRRAAVAPNGQ